MKEYENNGLRASALSLAVIAVMTALLIGAQFVLSFVAGVEVVSLLLAVFSVVYGIRRGLAVATCFSLLRLIVFGFSPNATVLYFIYYPCFAAFTGLYGKLVNSAYKGAINAESGVKRAKTLTFLGLIGGLVLLCTALTCCFTLLDDIIAPAIMGFGETSKRIYFYQSLPVMATHALCVAISVAVGFYPLYKVMDRLKISMRV